MERQSLRGESGRITGAADRLATVLFMANVAESVNQTER